MGWYSVREIYKEETYYGACIESLLHVSNRNFVQLSGNVKQNLSEALAEAIKLSNPDKRDSNDILYYEEIES